MEGAPNMNRRRLILIFDMLALAAILAAMGYFAIYGVQHWPGP
jgi:fatty acid desaturase